MSITLKIEEPSGPDEWLINMTLPRFYSQDFSGYPEEDMVVVNHDDSCRSVYMDIKTVLGPRKDGIDVARRSCSSAPGEYQIEKGSEILYIGGEQRDN